MNGRPDPHRVRTRLARGAVCVTATLPAIIAGALAVALPSSAIGAPAVPGVDPIVFDAPAGEFCAFPIELSLLDGTKLQSGAGVVVSTGPLSVTVTNLATGISQTFNASGPTFRDGTLTGTAIIGQPLSRGVGPAFLIINRGRVTFTPQNTINTITGSQIDVCAALT